MYTYIYTHTLCIYICIFYIIIAMLYWAPVTHPTMGQLSKRPKHREAQCMLADSPGSLEKSGGNPQETMVVTMKYGGFANVTNVTKPWFCG